MLKTDIPLSLEGSAINLQLPSPLEQLYSPLFEKKKIRFFIKRDDLIHPLLSGNKWRKLKYNLIHARQQKIDTLLSFGGAYSNHIHALAAAGKIFGFQTIGIIRGERSEIFSPTLQFAQSHGMQLEFIDRASYRNKTTLEFIASLKKKYGDVAILPEGGSNEYALPGCAEIVEELQQQITLKNTVIATAVGSGGTAAGLLSAKSQCSVLGVAVLKGAEFLKNDIASLLGRAPDHFNLVLDYHFGGYAKLTDELLKFVAEFKQSYGISIEPIYTGKLFYALFDLINKDYFVPESTIIALHTGGLQGLAGLSKKYEQIC